MGSTTRVKVVLEITTDESDLPATATDSKLPVAQDSERSEILPCLKAHNLVCYRLMDAPRRHTRLLDRRPKTLRLTAQQGD